MNSASSSETPRYSVVIVTYNSRDNIQVCLDSLRRCSRRDGVPALADHEVIVVDNASRDGTPDYLSQQRDIIPLLNRENFGFSKACNQGAAKAKGEFLIFLNPDTLVTPGWSEAMGRHFQDPAVGAVGPLSNYVAGLQRIDLHLPSPWREGAEIPGHNAAEKSLSLARILKEANSGRGVTTKLLIGFCLMMRRGLYEAMGGMDENLFLGNDDLDLSWRLRNDGRKLAVATDAFVFHEGQKSFKTEAKSHVDRLTQESTDALYVKLVDYYGGRDKVPSPEELWGIGWFSPSKELTDRKNELPRRAQSSALEATVSNGTRELKAWKGVTALIYLPADSRGDAAEKVERTLSTLPAADVVLLNCADWNGASSLAAGGALRRLDLGSALAARQALEIAGTLAEDNILFCVAGTGFTALFNHWLDKRAASLTGAPIALPARIEGSEASLPASAFLAGKSWLRDALAALPAQGDTSSLLAALGTKVQRDAAGKTSDAPWLMAPKGSAAPAAPAAPAAGKPAESWTPVTAQASDSGREQAISGYPAALGTAMRKAQEIAFAGTVAELLPVSGPFQVFDLKGERVAFKDQDLVILRVTADMIDSMPERFLNLRRRGAALKRLLVVVNGNQALRRKALEGTFLPPMDVTPDAVRSALWQSGFAVVSQKPYEGFPPLNGVPDNLQGWSLIEAAPRTSALDLEKKVSIVILGFNQVEYTKKCIESIRRHTRQRYELILVDNGSHDGTEAFFRSVPGAKVIRNAENLGVSKGWNQGMRKADGDYILIFNNDTIVGPGWVENLVRLAESDASIGMVGPRSNYIAGPQIVPSVPYKTEQGIQDFIREWQGDHDLSADEFAFIKGFCLLIPRRVFEKVGFFDERFGKGNFEDDDYCVRVRYHGFRTLMAHDSFIHHYGSVSFKQDSVDWKALMIENQKKYQMKWARGAAAIHDTQVSEPGSSTGWSSASAPAPSASAPLASFFEIDEANKAYERGEIETARKLFLEAQGKQPHHPEPYCGLGAIAFQDGHIDDAMTLFLRSLEIDPGHKDAAENLIDLMKHKDGMLATEDIALLARHFPENQVFSSALRRELGSAPRAPRGEDAKRQAQWKTDIEGMISRREFAPAIDLLESRLRSGNDLAACYNYMGVIAHSCGDHAFAAENFRNALKQGPADPDAVYNLADTLLSMGRADEALRLMDQPPAITAQGTETGSATAPEFAAFAEQIRQALEQGKAGAARLVASRDANQGAEDLLRSGQPEKARIALEDILREDAEDFRALNNMGLAEWYLGRGEEAWKRFRACLSLRPGWADPLINGFDAALATRRMGEFRPLLEKAMAAKASPEARRILAHVEREGLAIEACRSFESLEADAALLEKAEAAMQQERKSEAITLYLDAIKARPRNPQALNGLGVIAYAEKRSADAYGLFEAAAAQHPADEDILMNLWQAARDLHRENDVLPMLKDSLERNPSLTDVKAILLKQA